MARLRFSTFALAAALALGTAQLASASPINLMIGDNDGFGYGVADGVSLPPNDGGVDIILGTDKRSATEAAANDGRQQTDIYSALNSTLPTTFSLLFPFSGTLTSGTFIVDAGGFEATQNVPGTTVPNGPLGVNFNGVPQVNLFNFTDGLTLATKVHSFTLSAAALANANLAQQFLVTISRGSSLDAITFDYFQLTGNVEPLAATPEPATMLMLGTGLASLYVRRRRRA